MHSRLISPDRTVGLLPQANLEGTLRSQPEACNWRSNRAHLAVFYMVCLWWTRPGLRYEYRSKSRDGIPHTLTKQSSKLARRILFAYLLHPCPPPGQHLHTTHDEQLGSRRYGCMVGAWWSGGRFEQKGAGRAAPCSNPFATRLSSPDGEKGGGAAFSVVAFGPVRWLPRNVCPGGTTRIILRRYLN